MDVNATVCVIASEPLPVPSGLKKRKITTNPSSNEQLKVSSTVNFVLEYPESIQVLQNASIYARVVEPVNEISDNKTK